MAKRTLNVVKGVCFPVLLSAFALVGCAPPAPKTVPQGPEITVVPGGSIAVQAGAARAKEYTWTLAGIGRISSTAGEVTSYTAPEEGGMSILTVVACNGFGDSPKTSLTINVPPPTPAPTPTPSITITSPITQAMCPLGDECCFDVTGTSSGLASSADLGIVVFVQDGALFFPHKGATVESDGTWHRTAQVGDRSCFPAGYSFGLVALTMTQTEVTALPVEFQQLPEQHVAQSNLVGLATAYDPVQIDLSAVVTETDGYSTITIAEPEPSRLGFEYDLGPSGWVQASLSLEGPMRDMSCMKQARLAIVFSLNGQGEANTLEVKLRDKFGTTCLWRMPSVAEGLERVPLERQFDTCFDGQGRSPDLDWQVVESLQFAVSTSPGVGGAGHVEIGSVTLVPSGTP